MKRDSIGEMKDRGLTQDKDVEPVEVPRDWNARNVSEGMRVLDTMFDA